MREQGSGRIINFSSVSAWGSPGQPNYGAAKYGILGLTAVLANSLAKYGVTANAILPGATTRMIDSTPRGQQFAQEHEGKAPSELAEGTEGDPANVAPMVAYLATDDAAIVNGQFFGVRGNVIQMYSHWELADVFPGRAALEAVRTGGDRPQGDWRRGETARRRAGAGDGAPGARHRRDAGRPGQLGRDRARCGTWERRAYYDAKNAKKK